VRGRRRPPPTAVAPRGLLHYSRGFPSRDSFTNVFVGRARPLTLLPSGGRGDRKDSGAEGTRKNSLSLPD